MVDGGNFWDRDAPQGHVLLPWHAAGAGSAPMRGSSGQRQRRSLQPPPCRATHLHWCQPRDQCGIMAGRPTTWVSWSSTAAWGGTQAGARESMGKEQHMPQGAAMPARPQATCGTPQPAMRRRTIQWSRPHEQKHVEHTAGHAPAAK